MRTERLLASTSIRLSLIYSGLLIASFVLAIALTWIVTQSAAEDDLRNRIMLEVEALKAEIRDEGIGPAVAAIDARAEQPGALEYRLVDDAGNTLSGAGMPETAADGWHLIDEPDFRPATQKHGEMLVLTATMPDGSRLSVGDDLRRTEAVRDAVLRALLWIGAATAGLGLAAGVLAIRRSLAQMDALTTTMSEVAAGRLDARFTPRGGGQPNDFDRLGASFNRMLDHINALVQSLQRVSSDLAHDLRTPLSHVRQRLEEVQVARTSEARQCAIEAAEDQIAEVLGAFDAILRLSEIEAGGTRSHFVDVDAAGLLERVADAYRPDVESSGRSLSIDRIDRGWIFGDGELLAQALANLIENAMRHTPVRTRITLSVIGNGSTVVLDVSDNGPGIPAERRSESLQPFVRLDSSRGTAGFGLGLSIVMAIARLHDASLELGDAGPGLRVRLMFPSRQHVEPLSRGGAADGCPTPEDIARPG